ncbi:unnamed protein product [Acanthoscelides obtectus]|uniref:Uncharacterized protein n=1 Tax=Acanthoscelides obtectus TaxID=200917 RepID=A0A9P0KB04_ACAOB|nr:unnamed protein product [Acanthoscelides obtectus]CAK1642989.1 hypothetical protein AOBTE_LOCUS13342 [Acanthoscelides obtectus]
MDLAVFGPCKKYYGAICDRWMVNHAGKPITINDIGSLVGEAFLQAFTPKNICSGFRAAGIEPFNDQIFSDEEFLSSYVTDRPGKTSEEEAPQAGSSLPKPIQHGMTDPVLSQFQLSKYQAGPSQAESSSTAKLQTEKSQTKPTLSSIEIKKPTLQIITPEQFRPYPKAGERKSTIRRKKGKSLILTDTPVKENIEEEARLREEKAHKKNKTTNKKKEVKRRILEDSSSDDESVIYEESSDSLEEFDAYDDSPQAVTKGDFVIVKVYGQNKLNFRHYVGEIIHAVNDGIEVTFLKRHKETKYFFKNNENGFVVKADIVCKLPMPAKSNSARYANMVSFQVDLNEFDFTVY